MSKEEEKEKVFYRSNISHWSKVSINQKLMVSPTATTKEIPQKHIVKMSLKKFKCYLRKYCQCKQKQEEYRNKKI